MRTSAIVLATLVAALPAIGQPTPTRGINAHRGEDKPLTCENRSFNQNKLVTHCEMREQTLGFAGRLSVDPGTNGGVSVKGWDRADVVVRAKIEAAAEDALGAKALASQITVNMSAGQVSTLGPEQGKHQNWSVSYEIFVPKNGDLSIKTHNGGISVSDVRGRIQFEAMNGGVTLKRLAGDVEGHTMNGGLNIELAGDRWDGPKFDARTTNGGINITMPERYSAHLETATVNGNMNVDVPMTVRGEIGKRLSTDLGIGGSTVRVETTNGGINIRKASI
jgi:DUF4097 and DUF4098 domain-containing protein YvlB